jgi:hypothetical protein
MAKAVAATERRKRWLELRRRLEAVKASELTDELCDLVELALQTFTSGTAKQR